MTTEESGVVADWRTYEEQRLPRVLAAALETFGEKGYHGTTTRQLAEAAGMSVPGIYHHYASKQDILFDLMMVIIDELIERSQQALASAEDTPRAQFDALVESLLRFHMHRRRGAMLSTSELRSLEPENRARYVARRDEQQRMLDRIVLAGVESGALSTPYPADASRAIASLCVGVASWYRPDGQYSVDTLLTRFLAITESIVGIR
ncbi:TetR/AcrR family transcriptional regulator [Nocardioides sp. SYSU D00038]|uniref:TetR/AcrR family transcriptional regulator n=1 Tax=Nocardioides sp. SYSU D00038 TaxID=2812554 RepID=UPI00196892F0|nr:TetR/AcrR family transcriptional regulator [Nocardioides sp. SYSU D00038]